MEHLGDQGEQDQSILTAPQFKEETVSNAEEELQVITLVEEDGLEVVEGVEEQKAGESRTDQKAGDQEVDELVPTPRRL